MKRVLILTTCFLLVATPMLFAQGEPQSCSKAPQAPGRAPMMKCQGDSDGCGILGCKELNLTKEQMAKAEAINFAHRKAMIDLKASLEKARLSMHHEMNGSSPDRAKVLTAAKEANAIEAKMDEARINHQFDLRALLTPEQLEKWNSCCKSCGHGLGPMGQGKGCMEQGMGGGSRKGKGMEGKTPEGGCQHRI